MAAINRNIKSGNFVPGFEAYTRPEEIEVMGKYLRAGINKLNESMELDKEAEEGITNRAKVKSIKNLPEEVEEIIENPRSELVLSKLREVLEKKEDKIKLDTTKETLKDLERKYNLSTEKEKLEADPDISLDVKKEELKANQNISLNSKKESIEKNNLKSELENKKESITENKEISLEKDRELLSGKKNVQLPNQLEKISDDKGEYEVVDKTLYEKTFTKDPKKDKRSLPSPEDSNSRFKELDTILGGVHYNKYSSEVLSKTTTPTLDAVKKASEGSSDIIFVKSENIQGKEVKNLYGEAEKLSSGVKQEELGDYKDDLKRAESPSLHDKISDEEKIIGNKKEDLESFRDDIENRENLELENYVSDIMDGRVPNLETQKETLPDELVEVVLQDYLSKIVDENGVQLSNEISDIPGEIKDMILEDFIDRLNNSLSETLQLSKEYLTLGKKGAENFINDLYKNLSQLVKSNFSPFMSGEFKEVALALGIETIPESKGLSSEYEKQLADMYGLSSLTSAELSKTLDELINANGGWGRKVAAYLSSLLGKYEKFKRYLPEEEVENFKKKVTETFIDRKYEEFLKDTKQKTKEDIIKETFKLLEQIAKRRAENLEKVLQIPDIKDIIHKNSVYSITLGKELMDDAKSQDYGKDVTLKRSLENIKTALIDDTWEAIKHWVAGAFNGSILGASKSLLTTKVSLPGNDYSYDATIRNAPNIVSNHDSDAESKSKNGSYSFYNKRTRTTDFDGKVAPTALETGIGRTLSGAYNRYSRYNFKDNYLKAAGVIQTISELCPNSDITKISSVEDLYDTLKNSEYTTAHARTKEGVMNGMTLSSNHVWEITIEPYLSKHNGNVTWLPFIQEINANNYKRYGVRTIYDKWIPITSFELQDKRLVQKTLGLYSGEISYPSAIEFTNELRLTIADDSFKSFRTYFDQVSELSVYESKINNETEYSKTQEDVRNIKNRSFNYQMKDPTFDSINKKKFAVGMYKNLTYRIGIYIMSPQYSTIKKYDLLCVMKDYSIEYSGEIDSGPADVTVSFSIVGETNDYIENVVNSWLNEFNLDIDYTPSEFVGTGTDNPYLTNSINTSGDDLQHLFGPNGATLPLPITTITGNYEGDSEPDEEEIVRLETSDGKNQLAFVSRDIATEIIKQEKEKTNSDLLKINIKK